MGIGQLIGPGFSLCFRSFRSEITQSTRSHAAAEQFAQVLSRTNRAVSHFVHSPKRMYSLAIKKAPGSVRARCSNCFHFLRSIVLLSAN